MKGSGASEDGDGCDAMPTAKWARTEAAGAGLGVQDSLSLEEQASLTSLIPFIRG